MATVRLSLPAEDDLAHILAASEDHWGLDARRRYASLIAAAMRAVGADPSGPLTRDRSELWAGIRSFHIRHATVGRAEDRAGRPVHILYFREGETGVIEIVRVLHERMEPGRHISKGQAASSNPPRAPRSRR